MSAAQAADTPGGTGGNATTASTEPAPARASGTDAFIKQIGPGFLIRQEKLQSFESWLMTRPGVKGSGYLASIHDAAHLSVTMLWHGSSPLQGQARREAARRGIKVSVVQRKFGLAEITSASDAVWKEQSEGLLPGFKVSYIAGVTAGFDGIVVHGDARPASAGMRVALARLGTAVAGVPVQIIGGDPAYTAAGTRDTDYSPFDAGGYMTSPSLGLRCSSGFAINYQGTTHTTTARHCDAQDFQDRAASNTYGYDVTQSGDGGAWVLSAAGSARMFDGAYNNSWGYDKTVIGLADVGLTDSVCTSGGNSGIHCNVTVDAMVVSFNDGYGSFSTIHGTEQTAGAISNIQGDSGGPVMTLRGTSSGQVQAVGMIQGGDQVVSNCGPVYDPHGLCGTGVLFSSMRTIINTLPGASLVIG